MESSRALKSYLLLRSIAAFAVRDPISGDTGVLPIAELLGTLTRVQCECPQEPDQVLQRVPQAIRFVLGGPR